MTNDFRYGAVSLVGRPNVGKSTLLNLVVGSKISITSRRPQTTRNRILGIRTDNEAQIAFVDTPGLHIDHKSRLNRAINRNAHAGLDEVDLVVWLITADGWRRDDDIVLGAMRERVTNVILGINKIDKLQRMQVLLPLIADSSRRYPFLEIVPLSARRGTNVDDLLVSIKRRLPIAPPGFPLDQVTARSDNFMVAELIREQLFEQLGQELPYATAVELDSLSIDETRLIASAVIWVNKPSQKPIVLGSSGKRIREIGRRARLEIGRCFSRTVYLKLWVKVGHGWTEDESAIRLLGYIED